MTNHPLFRLFLSIFALLTLSSCAGLFPQRPYTESDETLYLFRGIRETNKDLVTFGGAGRVKLLKGTTEYHYPISFVGETPARMRLVLLNPVRRPLETLVSDGEHLFALSHAGKHSFYRSSLTSTSLRNLISISAGVQDLLAILAGRPPIRPHDHVSMVPAPEGDGFILTLTKRNGRIVEKIFTGRDKEVYKVAVYNIKGSVSWHAEFTEMQDKRGFRVPRRVTVWDSDTRLAITLDRYWDNIAVLPQAFVLEPQP